MAIQAVKLNLIPGSVLPVVNVSQYDDGRQFYLDVYEGSETYSLTGKTVEIRGTKPDMHGFAYGTADGVISVSGNRVTVSTTQQMTACGGQVTAELRISSGSVILGTLNFIIFCEPSALSDDTITSDTEIPIIERYLEDIVDDCEEQALISEGYAVGKQRGEAVSSGSPYYHNNADYYADQAGTSATNAGNSATAAGNSATSASNNALKSEGYAVGKQNGSAVSSGSPYYHNNAEYYNTQASGSATSAGTSATSASTNALKSEGFSVGEQNGTPVSSGSPYYQNNAKYYKEQAAHYAGGGLIFKGTVAFANIPTSGMANGDMYNISDAFTTDNRFIEGAGKAVAAGSDIAWIAGSVNKWDVLAMDIRSALYDLTDVTLTSPANGQALKYDGSKWVNGDVVDPQLLKDTVGWTGKNLLNYIPHIKDVNGGTITINANGTVTVNGTFSAESTARYDTQEGTSTSETAVNTNIPAGNCICSFGGNSNVAFAVGYFKSNDTIVDHIGSYIESNEETIVFPNDAVKIRCYIDVKAGTYTNQTFYPMLRRADQPADYEPYHESVEECMFLRAEQRVLGAKNLLPNTLTSGTYRGVPITVNSDGSITLNGTCTESGGVIIASNITESMLPKGHYIISKGVASLPGLYIDNYGGTTIVDTGANESKDFSIDYSGYTALRASLWLISGTQYNLTIKPMLRLASDPDDTYVPYAMTNRELTKYAKYKSFIKWAVSQSFAMPTNKLADLKIRGGSNNSCGFNGYISTSPVSGSTNLSFVPALPAAVTATYSGGVVTLTSSETFVIFLGEMYDIS